MVHAQLRHSQHKAKPATVFVLDCWHYTVYVL